MNLRQKLLILTLILASGIYAQDEAKFSNWDYDDDGVIERHEFTDRFTDKYFKAWDPSGKKGIVNENFFEASYAGLDTDADGYLKDQEWMIGYNYFFEDYMVYEDIGVVDTDEDGAVDYEEYHDVMYETNFFTDVDLDSDNYISEHELADFVFENWDLNDSGLISKSEFKEFKWYYLDV